MSKKPWPITLLALLFLSEPLFKLLFYSWYWQRDVHFLLTTTQMKSPYIFGMYFFGCPVAGVAIWAVKKWSLPVFLTIEALIVVGHFQNLINQTQPFFSIGLVCLIVFLNISVVSYFLIPAVRIAYLDPRVRWWARKPRYNVNWKCIVRQNQREETATLANLSQQGALVSLSESSSIRLQEVFFLEFDFDKYCFSLPGKIRYQKHLDDRIRYGVEFQNVNPQEKRALRKCIRILEKRRYPRRPKKENVFKSLGQFLYVFVTSGRGLIPSLTKSSTSQKEDAKTLPFKKVS